MIGTKYRKLPVEIEAVRYAGGGSLGDEHEGTAPDWLWEAFERGMLRSTNGRDPLVCTTLNGPVTVAPGEWIIRGVQGELYPCSDAVFQATYEAVPE